MGYPFEWAVSSLKHKMPVRRRSWPADEFVTSLGPANIEVHVPRVPRDWALLASGKHADYAQIVHVDSKTLVGFARVSRESDKLTPFVPTYDDMVAEDWDSSYGI